MSNLQRLRALLKQRLDAEDEIFELFERTIADFEEELTRLKEKERRYKLLEAVFSPEVHLHSLGFPGRNGRLEMEQRLLRLLASEPGLFRIDDTAEDLRGDWTEAGVFPADVQQMSMIEEEDPPQCSPNLEQQQHPEPLHIKEEQVEVWTSQLHQSQTEDNREAEPTLNSSATQTKIESGAEDCGGSEAARNQDPEGHSLLSTDEKASETEVQNEDRQESLAESRPVTKGSGRKRGRGRKKAKQSESDVNGSEGSQTVHTEEKKFGCDICGKTFKAKKHQRRHVAGHTQMRLFDCDYCGKTYKDKSYLKVHMAGHTEDKQFSCDFCGKLFALPATLKSHMRIHTEVRKFGCDVCGKHFFRQGHLISHMRYHTGEKPFSCEVCGKRFKSERNIEMHMMGHTGVRPFACDLCGERFKQHVTLNKHMKVHTT